MSSAVSAWTATTDAQGRFRIEGLPPGNLVVEAFAPALPWVRVDDPPPRLAPGDDLAIAILLPPARSVVLTVVDDRTGEPLPEVEVVGLWRTTRGPGRRVETPPVPRDGPWTVRVRAPGYLEDLCPATPREQFSPPPPNATVRLRRALPVTGVVRETGGKPVVRARLWLRSLSGDGSLASVRVEATTDSSGAFSAPAGIAGGGIQWKIALPGGGWIGGPTVNVPRDAEAVALPPVTLDTLLSLRGTILDPEGRPVQRAEISGRPPFDEGERIQFPYLRVVADPRGRFALRGLPPGPVLVYVSGIEGWATREHSLDLRKDEVVEWKLDPQEPIAGRVLDVEGRPVAGAVVTIDGEEVKTDAEGRFRLWGLEPGIRVVSVEGIPGPPRLIPAGSTNVEFVLPAKHR
ncbi:MAG: carboxypeptidase-like regulatory domain-containing protein [Planctomycetes bacterium]|nr:carboxypeptidase-like regulatory domain-containing protein [Planctomycetota bacterium]